MQATAFYQNLVENWKTILTHYSDDCPSLEAAAAEIALGDSFLSLVQHIPNVPCFPEAFEARCSRMTPDSCYNEDFGEMDTTQIDESTIKVTFGKLDRVANDYKKRYQAFIDASEHFRSTMEQLPTVTISPDLHAPISRKPVAAVPPITTSNITARTSLNRLSSFYVVDVETTGLNPLSDEIIQVSAVHFLNFVPADSFSTYVKPRKGIKPGAYGVNGISEKDVGSAPYIEMIMGSLNAFLNDCSIGEPAPIIGHNLGFDHRFLTVNGCTSFNCKRKYYDTLELARRHYPYKKSYKLDDLSRSVLKIIRSDAHDSLSDAVVTGLLFSRICHERIGF